MPKLVNAHIFEFPKPTGNYAVGTTSLHLIDQQRKELYTPDINAFREIMITVWYPTEPAHATISPYAPDYLMQSIKGLLKSFETITPDDLNQLDSIYVHVTPDAPIVDQRSYPLIIFSHGYFGSRFYCSALCQELASHGYVVIGIDHTYDCGVTQVPDGRLISWKSLTDASYNTDEFYDSFVKRIEVRTADIKFVIDTVAHKTNPLFNHVDLNKIGAFGHSLGAEAVLQSCIDDTRIQAVAAMDAFPVGNLLPNA